MCETDDGKMTLFRLDSRWLFALKGRKSGAAQKLEAREVCCKAMQCCDVHCGRLHVSLYDVGMRCGASNAIAPQQVTAGMQEAISDGKLSFSFVHSAGS